MRISVANDLMTTAEVAQLLRVSSRTVRLWAECLQLPAMKTGRHWKFKKTEIASWVSARTTENCESDNQIFDVSRKQRK